MRVLPILTALVVAALLYGVIMERERLQALLAPISAQIQPPQTDDAAEEAAAPAESAAAPDRKTGNDPVSVVVKASEAQTVRSGLVLAGLTEAARKVDLRSETSGLVISEPIAAGARIAKGDVMCELDPGTRLASLAEAKARLMEAQTNNRTASQLAERGFSSETAAISSMAALEGVEASVLRAEKEIERLKIHAPFDGLLESDTAELGSLLQPGSPCATLISLDPIKLVGFVPELEVEKLALGAEAGGQLANGRRLRGEVSFIGRSADPLTRTFRVEIEVPNPDNAIRDGQSVDILIGLDGVHGHLLPQSALTLNDSGTLGIRAHKDGVAVFHPVNVIRDDPRGMWLTGLPEKVDVIIVGQEFVRHGRAVIPTYRADEEATQ